MKTSNRILFITGIVIAVILFVSVLGSRFYLNSVTDSYEGSESNYTNIETEYKEFTNFTAVNVTGDWDVTISRSDSYSITVNSAEGPEDLYEIERKGDTLFVKENQNLNINKKLTLEITMPSIRQIHSEGGLKLLLTGFREHELVLNLTGGSWITGSSCEFENFFLNSAGAINLDFEKTLTFNADVQLAGAGNLLFDMTGGTLSGNASGAVNIEYYGNAKQEIVVSGLVNISRRN